MAESAGAGLMQLSGQDLASWKCFSYIYCARGGKSWRCRSHGAHRVEKDTLLEAHRFEEGHHRQHDGKTRTSCHYFTNFDLYGLYGSLHGLHTFWARGFS